MFYQINKSLTSIHNAFIYLWTPHAKWLAR